MKWSTPLPTGSIGIRVTLVQVVPFVEVVITRSFAAQLVSKRQSCQTTYTFPDPSISAEGSALERMLPASAWLWIFVTVTVVPQVVPPSVEVKASKLVWLALEIGTTTVPFG